MSLDHGSTRDGAPTGTESDPASSRQYDLVLQASTTDGSAIVVPGGKFLLQADFVRLGPDLLLVGSDGTQVLIQGYFEAAEPAALMTEGGALLPPDLVATLTRSETPGQYAQAGEGVASQPIGLVTEATGEITVTRVDGSREVLTIDSEVFQGDVLETGGGAALAITFIDETVFSLGEDARMVLDELIFDPSTGEGFSTVSVLEGVFVFVSGEIAANNPDEMAVRTPVATIGVRGTNVGGNGAAEGELNSVVLLPGGGAITYQTPSMALDGIDPIVITEAYGAASVSSVFDSPTQFEMSPDDVASFLAQLTQTLPDTQILQQIQTTIQAAALAAQETADSQTTATGADDQTGTETVEGTQAADEEDGSGEGEDAGTEGDQGQAAGGEGATGEGVTEEGVDEQQTVSNELGEEQTTEGATQGVSIDGETVDGTTQGTDVDTVVQQVASGEVDPDQVAEVVAGIEPAAGPTTGNGLPPDLTDPNTLVNQVLQQAGLSGGNPVDTALQSQGLTSDPETDAVQTVTTGAGATGDGGGGGPATTGGGLAGGTDADAGDGADTGDDEVLVPPPPPDAGGGFGALGPVFALNRLFDAQTGGGGGAITPTALGLVEESGFLSQSFVFPEAGDYLVGLGIMNSVDILFDSGVLLDNIEINDVPVVFDLIDFDVIGNAAVVDDAFGIDPIEGLDMGLVVAGGASQLAVEAFLGLASGALAALDPFSELGSAVSSIFTVDAGDELTFDINFLDVEETNQGGGGNPAVFNDYTFFSAVQIAPGPPNNAPLANATIDVVFEEALDFNVDGFDLAAGVVEGSDPGSTQETVLGALDFIDGDPATLVTGIVAGDPGGDVAGGVGVFIAGTFGVLQVQANGDFTYTLTTDADHSGGAVNDVFRYTVTDGDGDTSSNTLTIQIIDDGPIAFNDVDAVDENDSTSGNVIFGVGGGDDVAGADEIDVIRAVTHNGVTYTLSNDLQSVAASDASNLHNFDLTTLTFDTAEGGEISIDLVGGTVGDYDYTAPVDVPANTDEVFTYVLEDGDGTQDNADLTVTVLDAGGNLLPLANATLDAVFEDSLDLVQDGADLEPGLVEGSVPAFIDETVQGSLDFVDGDPATVVTGIVAGDPGGDVAGNVGLKINGAFGVIEVLANGDYTYTLTENADHSGGPVSDVFRYTVTDGNGDTSSNTLTIDIVDDGPIANDDDDSVDEGAVTSGNVVTGAAGANFFGPTAYVAFDQDSPFFGDVDSLAFDYFHLEDFEDGLFNTPGVASNNGVVRAPDFFTDSVDEDDGAIDGSGQGGFSFIHFLGIGGMKFTFDDVALGGLPTNVGLVWTDGADNVTFEAFGPGNVSLGVIGPVAIADAFANGQTAEDRFFGVFDPGGIEAIEIVGGNAAIEIDHLQYGQLTNAGGGGTADVLGADAVGSVIRSVTHDGITYTLSNDLLSVAASDASNLHSFDLTTLTFDTAEGGQLEIDLVGGTLGDYEYTAPAPLAPTRTSCSSMFSKTATARYPRPT